ncbi:hypothetical protein GE061_014886 [Apolygus lucorum]|uniref:C-type lectin domain-containing protein n=1 Tax=Apolygus lucorum TaxID=248454 RepID=A0A8S9XJF3_APOLU|nr:hypothetical protein GE061_014886 [Apolygus lucorum]
MGGARFLIILGTFVLVSSKSVKHPLSSIAPNQEDIPETLNLREFDDENPKTKKFELFTTEVVWEDALIKCKERHSDLATVRSKAEDDLVYKLYKDQYPAFNKYLWIGGTRLDSEKGFFWMTDGQPVNENFTNWMTGEPNNAGGNEQCLSYEWGGAQGKELGWNDLDCAVTSPYICEYY